MTTTRYGARLRSGRLALSVLRVSLRVGPPLPLRPRPTLARAAPHFGIWNLQGLRRRCLLLRRCACSQSPFHTDPFSALCWMHADLRLARRADQLPDLRWLRRWGENRRHLLARRLPYRRQGHSQVWVVGGRKAARRPVWTLRRRIMCMWP